MMARQRTISRNANMAKRTEKLKMFVDAPEKFDLLQGKANATQVVIKLSANRSIIPKEIRPRLGM